MTEAKATTRTLLIPYIRVSRIGGRRVEDRITERVQLDAMEAFVAMANARNDRPSPLLLDQPITEVNASGADVTKRPGFEAAIARIKDPRDPARGIIVMKLNRFARSTFDAAKLSRDIQAASGVLVSAQENIDFSTPNGKFQFDLMAALAELELNQLRETWKQNVGYLVGQGIHISRYVPFGYAKGADKRLYPHPEEAPVLVEAFERAAGWKKYPRHSWGKLTQFMIDSGLPPHGRKDGKNDGAQSVSWGRSSVVSMIQNPVYLGQARAKGPEKDAEGNARYHLDFVNFDAHEPLVSRELWDAANAKREENTTERKHGQIASQALLRGLVVCAGCGHRMVVTGQKAKVDGETARIAIYYCRRAYADGFCPTGGSIQARKLDKYIDKMFFEALENPVIAIRPATESRLPELEERLWEAQEAMRQLVRNMSELARALGGDDEVAAHIKEMGTAIDALREEIEEERERTEIRAGINTGELKDHWKRLPDESKRRYYKMAYESIAIRPTGGKRGHTAPSAEERVGEILLRKGLFA
jgi:DNA invertase Pin-like site-specific DNA recombinase